MLVILIKYVHFSIIVLILEVSVSLQILKNRKNECLRYNNSLYPVSNKAGTIRILITNQFIANYCIKDLHSFNFSIISLLNEFIFYRYRFVFVLL